MHINFITSETVRLTVFNKNILSDLILINWIKT